MVDYGDVLRHYDVDPSDKAAVLDALARAHGDIEDAKASLIFIADEEGFDLEAPDVETVTDEPPASTFT